MSVPCRTRTTLPPLLRQCRIREPRRRILRHAVIHLDHHAIGHGAHGHLMDAVVGVAIVTAVFDQTRETPVGMDTDHADVVGEDLRTARPAVGPVPCGDREPLARRQIARQEGKAVAFARHRCFVADQRRRDGNLLGVARELQVDANARWRRQVVIHGVALGLFGNRDAHDATRPPGGLTRRDRIGHKVGAIHDRLRDLRTREGEADAREREVRHAITDAWLQTDRHVGFRAGTLSREEASGSRGRDNDGGAEGERPVGELVGHGHIRG